MTKMTPLHSSVCVSDPATLSKRCKL